MITEPDSTQEKVAREAKWLRFYGIVYLVFAVAFFVLGIHSIFTKANAWYGYFEVLSAVLWSWIASRNLKQASTN